jgi:hypothetical protein
MPPTQAPSNGLDPQIVNLAQAIRQVESNNNPTAVGKSGEYGAYQFEPATWAAKSAAAGVNVPLQQSTLQQQNEVAYKTLASWKQQHPDWNIGNFASAWNAGEGAPNAYQENHVGTNSMGVSYDTPGYAKKVADAYHAIKSNGGQQSNAQVPGVPAPGTNTPSAPVPGIAPPQAPAPQPQATTPPPAAGSDPSGGFFQGLQEDLSGTNPDSIGTQIGNTLIGAGNFLFPSVGDAYHDIKGDNKKTLLQQAGDLGTSALGAASLIPGLDVVADPLEAARAGEGAVEAAGAATKTPGLLARLAGSNTAKNVGYGAGYGLSGSLGNGQTDPSKILENTALGAVGGGVLGKIGDTIGGALTSKAGEGAESRLADQTNRLKTLSNSFKNNSTKDSNPISTLTENGLTKDLEVTQDGRVNAEGLTNPQQTGSLDNLIQTHSDKASDLVKSMTGGVPTDEYRNTVLSAIKNNPDIVNAGNVSKASKEVNRIFDDYTESYGQELPYTAIDAIRARMNKVYNPDEIDVARTIGDTARKTLYEGDSGNPELKATMQNEAKLIRAKNFVEKLHGTVVKGGRLGKYVSELVGAGAGGAVGHLLGPVGEGVGTIAGAGIGKLASKAVQGNYFDPLGGKLARYALKGGALKAGGKLVKSGALRALTNN